jgi:5-methyltetrahydropteroyltriglutamate--homocysteine methyltransferase
MIQVASIGYPRIGPKRELKKALEQFWKGEIQEQDLHTVAKNLRKQNWQTQKSAGVDLISSNDFSFYDQVLDAICLLGAVPKRYKWDGQEVNLTTYFAMARGSQTADLDVPALEMTKWFDTNYHYLVPELSAEQTFKLSSNKPFEEYEEAKQAGFDTKPIILGPLTFLLLAKGIDGFNTINLLDKILPIYKQIVEKFSQLGAEWIQIDEPILVKDLDSNVVSKIKDTLNQIKGAAGNCKILLATYFEDLNEDVKNQVFESNVDVVHLDLVRGSKNKEYVKNSNKKLSLGLVDGRNVWKTNLQEKINFIKDNISNNVIIASSCPLLHSPYDLELEQKVPVEIKRWLSFAKQKLLELNVIKGFINEGSHQEALDNNAADIHDRETSKLIHDNAVKDRIKTINKSITERKSSYVDRAKIQKNIFFSSKISHNNYWLISADN